MDVGAAGTGLAALSARIEGDCPWIAFETDLDTAVQRAEDRLLSGHHETRDTAKYSLASMEIFSGLDAEDLRMLEGIVSTVSYSAGQKIMSEGDPANAFFVLASGTASVSITLGDGRQRRLASIGPGASFGERALVEAGRRSADVHADGPVVAYIFSLDRIQKLAETRPRILLQILSNIVRDLSQRLQQANEEIRNLE